MKKRTALIGALVSLLPIGQQLLIGTGAILTSAALMLAASEKVQAESAVFYYNLGIDKYDAGDYYGAIADYTKAIESNLKYAKAYNNRGRVKYLLGDNKGACKDAKKSASHGNEESKRILSGSIGSEICRSSINSF